MKSNTLKKTVRNQLAKAFTLIELLVVIAIIALLLSILMPSLSKVKEQARKLICSSNLGQVGKGLEMYTLEYDYKRITLREKGEGNTYWMGRIAPYLSDDQYKTDTSNRRTIEILLCPSAPASKFDASSQKTYGTTGVWGLATAPWEWAGGDVDNTTLCSYTMNGWVGYDHMYEGTLKEWLFKDWLNIPGNTPIFGDGVWVVGWPKGTDLAPPDLSGNSNSSMMDRYCIDRHNKTVNLISRDLSVENIRLEALWTQKWHVGYEFPDHEIELPGR